ncbi:hypothetical protein [Kribbella sp. NPDC048915]
MRPEQLPEGSKVVLGGFDGPELAALVDLLRGFPHEHTAYVGLLEVHGK